MAAPNGQRQMQIRLPQRLYVQIGLQAVRYDRSRSALIRAVMESWLAREAQKAAAPTPSPAAQRTGQVVQNPTV
jgi:predicted transcriptional regulator